MLLELNYHLLDIFNRTIMPSDGVKPPPNWCPLPEAGLQGEQT